MALSGGRGVVWVIGGAAVLAVAAFSAFWALQRPPEEIGGPLTSREFTLGGESFSIGLPESAKVSDTPGASFVWIEMRPGHRTPASIWLEAPYDESQPFTFDRRRDLDGGGAVEYRVSVNEVEVGSGGAEANLDGRLSFDGRTWSVACVTQREGAVAEEAEWCLKLLESLSQLREE